MKISACFVTRNHAQSLARSLKSVESFVHEIIIVDTGSTDSTVSIAETAKAKVIPFQWADDFSAACNKALDAAAGDWILWLNPDEEVSDKLVSSLEQAVEDSSVLAWRINVLELSDPAKEELSTFHLQTRFFRNDPSIRHQGRLHPSFVVPIEELAIARAMKVGVIQDNIVRHAYLSQPTPEKMQWTIRLLEAELRDRPGQIGYMIELGRNLLWLSNPKGHEVLAEAALKVRQVQGNDNPPSPWVGSLIEYLLNVSPHEYRGVVTKEEVHDWVDKWFSNAPPILFALAQQNFVARDYKKASAYLEKLTDLGRIRNYGFMPFDPAIVGSTAYVNLGLCYLHLGRWDEAKACFGESIKDPVNREKSIVGIKFANEKQKPA